jgi:hypothetical protein
MLGDRWEFSVSAYEYVMWKQRAAERQSAENAEVVPDSPESALRSEPSESDVEESDSDRVRDPDG